MDRINVLVGGEGRINAQIGIMPEYTGEYTVVPQLGRPVILRTKNYRMTENVTVEALPLTEQPNDAGGITLTVGGRTDE